MRCLPSCSESAAGTCPDHLYFMQTACLVLATHQVLLPFVRNEEVPLLCWLVGLPFLHQQLPFHYFSPWLSTLKAAALTHLSRAKELIDIIKAQMGNATSPMLRYASVGHAPRLWLLLGLACF